MDKNTKKVLKLINKLSKKSSIDIDIIRNDCKIPIDDFYEILSYLSNDEFIKFPKNGYAETTNKGKTYLSALRSQWISEHIIETLSLIISIIALTFSIIAFFRTL